MNIWGKIIGGAAGYALGGPIGALVGAMAGHAVDELRGNRLTVADDEAKRQVAFTVGVIALAAKLAKVDGRVVREEIAAFKQVFQIPTEELANVGRLFDLARRDASGFEVYAGQLAKLFAREPEVLEELLDGLFHIARADGDAGPAELAYLEAVAKIFGLDEAAWMRLKATNVSVAGGGDPYAVLGLTRSASDEALKQRYRALVREHHPDRLMAEGLPPEFVRLATEKLAAINSAYDAIKAARGLS